MQDSGVLLKATGSIKRKRGLKPQKASNNDMEIVENGQILEMEEPKCRMCNKIYADSSELNNLSNNKIMQKNLKSFVQVEDIQDFLTSICNSCLFKINSAKEIERTLRRRIKSKKCENQDILPIDTPLSINVQPQNCNYEQQDAMHKAECNDVLNISLTPPLYSPHNGHDYDEVHASPQEDLNISNTNESSNTDKQSTKTQANMLDNISNGNLSMLEVFCEHTESALITESGGKINNYRKSPPIVKQMICQYCQKIYYRKNYFAKHLKRCQANGRKFKNNLVNGSAKTGLDTSVDEYAENNIGDPMPSSLYDQELQRAQDHRKLLFQCKECAVKVDNIGKLRKHRKIHLKRFFCDICNGEFTTMHNYEFHRIECEAKLAIQNYAIQETSYDNRRTRTTRSRAASIAGTIFSPKKTSPSTANNDIPASTPKMEKSKHKKPSTQKTKAKSTVAKSLPPPTPAKTKSSKEKSRRKTKPKYKQEKTKEQIKENLPNYDNVEYDLLHYEDDDVINTTNTEMENSDEDDDDVSVADTMYSKRMRFTDNWVHDHSNSNSYLSLCDELEDELDITTHKEYDLYLLDRLKTEAILNFFTCYEPNCNFKSNLLLDVMKHDFLMHYKKANFYCKKCGGIFSSKVYLDYHLHRQNGGRFICFKCAEVFEFQDELDRHLLRHSKNVNYCCNYCEFEFLTENELLTHCHIEQHDPNGERPLIRIDHSMTIRNYVPPEPKISQKYKVFYKEMHLPAIESKRPMELPNHQPYRIIAGKNSFGTQKNPNCWGWESMTD